MLGKKRFADVVRRQLDLFEDDSRGLLAEAAEADASWTHAESDDSEELYGDYQLVVDEIGERLHDVREAYAASLDEPTADEYREAFNGSARKRFRRYTTLLDDE